MLTLRGAADDAGSAFITDRDNVIDKGDCWLSLCGWSPDGCGSECRIGRLGPLTVAAALTRPFLRTVHGEMRMWHQSWFAAFGRPELFARKAIPR